MATFQAADISQDIFSSKDQHSTAHKLKEYFSENQTLFYMIKLFRGPEPNAQIMTGWQLG